MAVTASTDRDRGLRREILDHTAKTGPRRDHTTWKLDALDETDLITYGIFRCRECGKRAVSPYADGFLPSPCCCQEGDR